MSLLDQLLKGKENPDQFPITYEESRELATHSDVSVRRVLAEREDVVPEVLYFLAEDPDPVVRRNIAGNESTPPLAHMLLSKDSETDVRVELAGRIAALAPGLSENEQDRLRHATYDALSRLARDQIPKVRAILSDTLKDVAGAPPAVIRRLARDAEVAVSAPILEFSPVLTTDDLLEVIRTGPGSGQLSAISKRQGLQEPVSDAIVATDDTDAITDLLSNTSAQIREETLDAVIERARGVPEWHAPLVVRPQLHAGAAQRLALFVADNLVEALLRRRDLDPTTALAVSQAVKKRLGESSLQTDEPAKVDFGPNWREQLRDAHLAALLDFEQGLLTEQELAASILRGDRFKAIAALAALAEISPFAVAGAIETASPKAVVSVAWQAGMTPQFAVHLQMKLAKVPPDELIEPNEDGEFSLSEAEMAWQVEMFDEQAGRRKF